MYVLVMFVFYLSILLVTISFRQLFVNCSIISSPINQTNNKERTITQNSGYERYKALERIKQGN